jgi:hypothetical protein
MSVLDKKIILVLKLIIFLIISCGYFNSPFAQQLLSEKYESILNESKKTMKRYLLFTIKKFQLFFRLQETGQHLTIARPICFMKENV